MEWIHAEFSLEREQYLEAMWEAYKKERTRISRGMS